MTSVLVGMQSADNVKGGSERLLRAQGEQVKLIVETPHETLRQPVTNVSALFLNTAS